MFSPNTNNRVSKNLQYIAILMLFLAGVAHWIFFFNWGKMTFQGLDWPKEGTYYAVLQNALKTGQIPYHVSKEVQETNRFLALPETILSPQTLLLRYIDITQFAVLDTLILYGVGFWGCLLIRRRFRLSLLPFTTLYLLFHFNGYITSHLAVGHSMWNGYFLLPLFCLCILDLIDGRNAHSTALKLGLAMFAMNLQGSLHMYVWCLVFLALIAIANRRLMKPLAVATIFSFWTSAFRLIPAALTYWKKKHAFITGYPTVMDTIHGFITIRPPNYDGHGAGLMGSVGWWEYDIYMGLLAFVAILYFGVIGRMRHQFSRETYRELDWPLGLLGVLSMSAFYAVIAKLPLPFVNSERVPSRFLITVVVMLIVLSCIRMQTLLTELTKTRARCFLFLFALIQTAFELATHSKLWRIDRIAQTFFHFMHTSRLISL